MSDHSLSRGAALAAMLGVAIVYAALGFVGGVWAAGPGYAGALFTRHAPIVFTAKPGVRQVCGQDITP
jgi:hypothetical protein